MLAKRIIPCLDIKDGRVVKGTNFEGLRDAGDPLELAQRYNQESADELVFLDIAATLENRSTTLELVKRLAKNLFIPFTIGGGISSLSQIRALLSAGADKISVNSSVLANPQLIDVSAKQFGSQCIVVAMDVKKMGTRWRVFSHGGSRATQRDAEQWAKEVQERGAGEILLTSMDCDGTQAGFDLELTARISNSLHIPVIASGGVGSLEHFKDAFEKGAADAALAASVFHYQTLTISEVKHYLKNHNIPVRMTS